MFEESELSRKQIITITDGFTLSPQAAEAAATEAKNAGIGIISIGVGTQVNQTLLQSISSDPATDLHIANTFCDIRNFLQHRFNSLESNMAIQGDSAIDSCHPATVSPDAHTDITIPINPNGN